MGNDRRSRHYRMASRRDFLNGAAALLPSGSPQATRQRPWSLATDQTPTRSARFPPRWTTA